jgi:hypothetical protein
MSFTTSLGYTPQYKINRGGVDVTSQFNDRVTLIKVTSYNGDGNLDKIDISLDDRDWAIATPTTDDDGTASLELFMGYAQSGLYSQGNFAINTIYLEGTPRTLRLEGTSTGFSSPLKSPLITSHDGKTIQDIVSAFAGMAGLSAVVDPELGSKTVDYLNQSQSPHHILQALERTYNGLVKYGDGKLSFTKRGSGENASGLLSGGFTLSPEDFGSWSVKISQRTAYSGVKAQWFDSVNQTTKTEANTTAAGGTSQAPFLIRKMFPTQDEAKAAADSQMQAFNRGLITGTLTLAKGDPSIHGGAPFTITGMKAEMNGAYIANTVTHTFSKQGGISTTIEFSLSGDQTNFEAAVGDQANPDSLGYNDPENVGTGNTPVTPRSPTAGGAGSA